MKTLFTTLFATLALLWSLGAAAQTLVFHLSDGTATDVELSSAFRMFTANGKIIISIPDENIKEFSQSDILSIAYREIKGDVNRDNAVDVADISSIISIMAGEAVQTISVTTGNVSNITDNSVNISGSVSGVSSPVRVGVLYGSESALDLNSPNVTTTALGDFTIALTDLKPNTTYYYCVFAEVDGTYYYGETNIFITEDSPNKPYNRTVLIYVAGDNNLTNYFTSDLRQIMQGTKNLATNNKLILYVDDIKNKPYFAQVEQGDTILLKSITTETKTSDPETLYEAMKYVTDNFTAESYGLVLWGHDDGWIIHNKNTKQTAKAPRKAYGVDYTGGRTYMDIPDMAKALARLPKLKFIFADYCCFMCAENVYELRNCADYIIGSPAEIPGEGAPYHTVVPAMFSKESTFYKEIIDKYYEQKSNGYDVPLCAVETSQLEDLTRTTAATLKSFANTIEPDEDGCRYPNMNGLIFYYDHTQYDMQDFMLSYASNAQYTEWKRVFDRAVPASTYSSVWLANHVQYANRNYTAFADFTPTKEREGGLGMFVPQRDSDAAKWDAEYRNNLGVSMSYLNDAIKSMQWYKAAQLSDIGW